MKILLTRSTEENSELAKILEIKNYEIIEFPLISFEPLINELQSLKDTINEYILIITSKYAAKLAAKYYAGLNLKAYVVGTASADILKEAGFEILALEENIDKLLKLVPETDNLLFLRGTHISQDLCLRHKEAIIYNSYYVDRFPDKLVNQIKNQEIQTITLFSLNCAKALQNSIKFHKLESYVQSVSLFCLSKNIGSIFGEGAFKELKHPNSPNMEEFLRLF